MSILKIKLINSLNLTYNRPFRHTCNEIKFPQMIKHFLALVIATFNLCELLMNPTPFVRVVEIITISFSCPWYESIVFTIIGNGPSELKKKLNFM